MSSINFVSNGSISEKYLGVGTGHTEETVVATAVVMAPVREARNAGSTASGIVGAVVLSPSPAFAEASSGAFLFVHPPIVQPS